MINKKNKDIIKIWIIMIILYCISELYRDYTVLHRSDETYFPNNNNGGYFHDLLEGLSDSVEAAHFKPDNDLEKLSSDEWLSLSRSEFMKGADTKIDRGSSFALMLLRHLIPLAHYSSKSQPFINDMPSECEFPWRCQSIICYVYDEILNYPKLLNNMIKIAEKPCSYFKEFKKPLLCENDFSGECGVLHSIKSRRNFFSCDNNSKPRIIIRIVDKNLQEKYDIVVPRIDTTTYSREYQQLRYKDL